MGKRYKTLLRERICEDDRKTFLKVRDMSEKFILDAFREYFKEIRSIYLTEDYTEYTFRTPFQNFIENLNKDFNLHQEQKRVQKLGAPDFKAYRKASKIGYIETKDLGKNLDNELESEQIKKYKESINNIILTDYSRFIIIRNNQKIFDLNLFNLSDLNNSRFTISEGKIEEFITLVDDFFGYKIPTIKSAKELAEELSKKARLLKDLAEEQLEEDLSKVKSNERPSPIYYFYEGIRELIKDINIDDCADAYAQTITYGLFLSKINCTGEFKRGNTAAYIPQSIGVIKRIFTNISGGFLPSNILWIVDEIIDILNASDIKNILSEIDFRGKKDRDPFTFFYEDFLDLYDPKKRKHLGIYYTPRPVVNFIVNSVNRILKDDFNKLHGFADDDVTVLDPAIGTGTFLWIVFLVTLGELVDSRLKGLIKNKIENHILKNFYGFEILITPYIISHLKLTTVLRQWYYKFKDNDRIQVYLTNTLEPSETHGLLPFMGELTEESIAAERIKNKPILVVLANPPYSVSSSNKSEWIMEKMKDYKKDLHERNIQPLDDDYIKFIRFAQWKIEQNGGGIVGYITNNSYLDGVIHRQMRKDLLDTFDRIYILNLHGSSRREEKLPSNVSKDENVFDIQQGVAIVLFVKNDKFKDKKVFYADLYGKRKEKYSWLDRNRINTVEWQELKPETPYYFFVKKDLSLQSEYEKFWKVTEVFKKFQIGLMTGQDNFFVDTNPSTLKSRILAIFNKNLNDKELKSLYSLKSQAGEKTIKARNSTNFSEALILSYAYRPFDIRYVYAENKFLWRSVEELKKHFIHENIALVTTRILAGLPFNHVLVTQHIGDNTFISSKTKERNYFFPLYIYNGTKQPNFTEKFIDFIDKQYPNEKITPENILGYIYAVLHSPTYRQEFNEFLKFDFPRIPFTKDYSKFKQLSEIGKELTDLHLMKTKLETSTKFDVQGSNVVKSVKYKENKAYINKDQFFDGIPEDVWNFYIGGYRVLDKWLKSRKNRELSSSEIEHFLQVVEIIKETIEYMKKIDEIKIF